MEYKNLILEKEDDLAIVKINRPPVNALNSEVVTEIHQMFDELEKDEDVKVIILTGEGKAFVAGADISEMVDFDPSGGAEFSKKGQAAFDKIENTAKPVIAAINGFALGGGCEIAMACDIRLAVQGAKLGQPEVNLGVIPGFAGTQRLPRLVGKGKAKELIFTGNMITAEEAQEIGLVNQVLTADELMNTAREMAKTIASKGPAAVRAAKHAINEGVNYELSKGLEIENQAFARLFETEDQKEGMKAFLEKRKPEWKDK
jgi:enoyl-CoA hydratase